jgi:phosphoribosylamine--glycine ligase
MGVIVCTGDFEAERAAHTFLVEGAAGEAGRRVMIEERLDGEEVSLLAICDGEVAVPLAAARDYKRVDDDDEGANTGGMGAYSPIGEVDEDTASDLVDAIHTPVLRELSRRGVHFAGCLYAGLMLTADGPRVLEFNTRFGDPEAQVLLPRLAEDVVELMLSAATGRLEPRSARFASAAAVGVVLATRDYPRQGENGLPISGVDAAERVAPCIRVYHAGTALHRGALVTAGGRVVCVTALGTDLREARDLAYTAADQIRFDGAKRRSDIALRAVGA